MKTLKLHIILTLILSIVTGILMARDQEITIAGFYVQDKGQTHAQVIFEDSQGFIWFGRFTGLYKYDGYDLTLYQHDPTDSLSLSDNDVQVIGEDKNGFLWVGTTNGLNKFNPANGTCRRYFHDPRDSTSLSGNQITAIFIDRFDVMWIGTHGGGLNQADLSESSNSQKLSFRRYQFDSKNPNSMSNNEIYCIQEDLSSKGNYLWIGTACGLNAYQRGSDQFTRFFHDVDDTTSLSQDKVWSLYRDDDGELWIGTGGGGLNRLNRQSDSEFTFSTFDWGSNSQILTITGDASDNLWIGTLKECLFIYNKKTKQCRHISDDPDALNSFRSSIIYSVITDRSNTVWLSCQSGPYKYDPQKEKIRQYSVGSPNPWTVGYRGLTSVHEDDNGTLWIGAWGEGLVKFDLAMETFRILTHEDGALRSLCSPWITSITPDRYGHLWLGTKYGLDRFDPVTEQFQHFRTNPDNPNDPHHLSSNFIHTVLEDSRGSMWIATARGLDKYNPESDLIEHYLMDTDTHISSIGYYIGDMLEEGPDYLLLAAKGLYQFDKTSGRLTPFFQDSDSSKHIMKSMIGCLHRDAAGDLWIATYGEGLFCWTKKGEQRHYSEQNGLPSNFVQGILEDDDGFLWISTFSGLVCLDKSSGHIQRYHVADDFFSNEFRANVFHRGQSGRFYFGNMKGLVALWPLAMHKNPYIPPVVITELKIFNEPVLFDRPFNKLQNIRLSYKQNMFSFGFTALNYTNSHKNRYAYKMEGFHKDWIQCGSERNALLMNLDPGRYVFRVKGSNNDGIWNEEGASIPVIITPPFWKTAWFRILALIVIAGLIYGIYRYQINKVRALERMRIQIASDLHDDIGSSLTKIAVHSEIIQTTNERKRVGESSRKIGQMSREIITTLSDIVWSIDARNDTVGDLIDRMRDFLDSVFSAGSIYIDFQTNGLNEQQKINQTERQNIYLIFKEAVNNAAKHAHADKISIVLSNGPDGFLMDIADDGIGIDLSEERTGHHGLANITLRAQRMGGEVKIENRNGTRLTLTARAI